MFLTLHFPQDKRLRKMHPLFKKNRRRKVSQVAQASIQSLENRRLLTGDVSVELSSADSRDLQITGDGSSNQIIVEEIAVDRIRVSGRDGTRVNGGNSATFTVRDDVRIDMNGGNDTVTVRNLNLDNYSHSDLSINLGTGNDTLVVDSTDLGDDLDVVAGHGNDDIDVLETTASDVRIDGEYGDDEVFLDELAARASVSVDTGEDDDTVSVYDSNIGNDLIITTDAGQDDAIVHSTDVADDISINTGSNNDYVAVDRSNADDITIQSGSGADTVYVYYNDVADRLYASLGSGNDELIFWANDVGRHYFNGGTGQDTWRNPTMLDYFWTWSNFYNFE